MSAEEPKISGTGQVADQLFEPSEVKSKGATGSAVRKPSNSYFFVTINTNQVYSKDDLDILAEDAEILDQCMNHIWNSNLALQYLKYKPCKDGYLGNEDDIEWLRAEWIVERGFKQGRLHAHILIKIKHYTCLHINHDKLRVEVGKMLGLGKVHVDVKYVATPLSSIEDYIRKNIKGNLKNLDLDLPPKFTDP
jgi:hypothetical protein